jgi:hypothetical protein
MSKRDHLFQIVVRCSNHAQVPRERILGRDTEGAAIDAAVRELRRTRNTTRNGQDFDTWDLYDFDNGRARRRLLRSGHAFGPNPSVPRDSNDHGAQATH